MKKDYLILSVLRPLRRCGEILGILTVILASSHTGLQVGIVAIATSMDSGHIFARIALI